MCGRGDVQGKASQPDYAIRMEGEKTPCVLGGIRHDQSRVDADEGSDTINLMTDDVDTDLGGDSPASCVFREGFARTRERDI